VSSNWKVRRLSMRKQNRLPASHVPLMLPWNQPQVTGNLVERVSMLAQPLPPSSLEFTAVRVGKYMTQTRCGYIRHCWSAYERLHLLASVPREGTVYRHDLINATYAVINVLRYPLKGILQGEIKLCQK
jgi:hypothetical protein